MEIKSKLYLRTILLINDMMVENQFVNCQYRVISCKACITVSYQKNVTKKKERKARQEKKVTPGWTDLSGPGPVSFFIQKLHVLH